MLRLRKDALHALNAVSAFHGLQRRKSDVHNSFGVQKVDTWYDGVDCRDNVHAREIARGFMRSSITVHRRDQWLPNTVSLGLSLVIPDCVSVPSLQILS